MDKKGFTRLIGAVLIGLHGLTVDVFAADALPARISALTQCSRADLKAFRWIHVGYAALYLRDCQSVSDILSAAPKRLRFLYQRSIPAKAFRDAAEEYLKINLGTRFGQWRQSFQQFNAHYRDVGDGDFYELAYDQNGLKLLLNDQLLATLPDQAQAAAYFSIWFGEEPFSEDLKKALLTPTL